METGAAAERRTSVTKPIATVNLRQENIIWLETCRQIRTDCKNGAEMISGDVATFGASTQSANGWKRRTTATYESFFSPPSRRRTMAPLLSSGWMQPTPMSMPTIWIALPTRTRLQWLACRPASAPHAKSTFQPQNHETVRLPITLTERR